MSDSTYCFSVYASPISFPLIFAVHTWVVLESPEFGIHRYEIHRIKKLDKPSHFYTNDRLPKIGLPLIWIPHFFISKSTFSSKCLYEVFGEQAKHIVLEIENTIHNYPYAKTYVLYPGPNSNTFTQWVIEKAGLAKRVRLPWNAFGKHYCNWESM